MSKIQTFPEPTNEDIKKKKETMTIEAESTPLKGTPEMKA